MEDIKTPDINISKDVEGEQVENTISKKKSPLPIIIATLSFLILVIVGVIVYFQFFNAKDNTTTDDVNTNVEDTDDVSNTSDVTDGVCSIDEENCDDTEEVESTEMTDFSGNVLSAQLPKGWRLIEYMDGEGTDYLIEDETYTGLTGLAIVNPDSKRVFSMMAVTGIGFAGCPVYAQFEDDNPSYFAEMEDAAMVVDGTWDVKDYTNVTYSEFEFLGTTIRRINKDYYYDAREGNNYFEPPCVDGVIGLEGLMFTDSGGYDGEAYFYGAEDTATEVDLDIVDTILESVKLVN
jgi:hypothetical protein